MASRKTDPVQRAWEAYVRKNHLTRISKTVTAAEASYESFKAGWAAAKEDSDGRTGQRRPEGQSDQR